MRAALLAFVLVPFVVFPPVRLRSKNQAATNAESFSAQKFATTHWNEKILPGISQATDVNALSAALDTSAGDAAKKFARTVGIGGAACYFVSGEGFVSSVEGDDIHVSLTHGGKDFAVLDTGLVFGNAVRDGTGLLDVNTFANSEEFNAIASELNAIVERDVLPVAKKLASPGTKIRFAGVAELTDTTSDPRPLRLVPVRVEAAQ